MYLISNSKQEIWMPTLEWLGKERIVAHHLEVPFHVLEHQYGFDSEGRKESATECGNKIIHGDNLVALTALSFKIRLTT